MVELPGITEEGDTVKGWLTEDDIQWNISENDYYFPLKIPSKLCPING